jgi:hypothetical protein
MTAPDIPTVTASDPRWADTGITARQRDYWSQLGLLLTIGEARPGSGYQRVWPETEIEVAALMVRLIVAGIIPPVAARIARNGIHEVTEIGPGLYVGVECPAHRHA